MKQAHGARLQQKPPTEAASSFMALTCIKPRLKPTAPSVPNVCTAVDRTRGRAWMAIRRRVLRSEPRCVMCLQAGRLAAATEVDHRIPLRQGGTDDDGNLQGLCHDCHVAKTAREIRAISGR